MKHILSLLLFVCFCLMIASYSQKFPLVKGLFEVACHLAKKKNCRWTLFDVFKARKMLFVKLATTVFGLCSGCLASSSFWGKERVFYQWWVRHRGSAAVRSPLSVERQQPASAPCLQINSRQTIITFHTQVFLEVRAPCSHWEDRLTYL